ncbi:MAG TPA: class I SAM-dependent methyltransferase [Urbifossiella sp.]|jgi:ubiquinone/menaquinone biosynthesis C-methylase UbiE|nr:class I SAM-dependent methyltransferase [Urbifossiella sp.]
MRKLFAALGLAALAAAGLTTTAAAQGEKKDDDRPKIVVPYVPTHHDVVKAMLKTAEVKEGDTVYDLGCGDGRIVIAAVKDFKAKKGLGLDFNPERLKDCDKSIADAKLTDDQKKGITFKQGDVLKLKADDFKGVDVVTLYLLPSVNRELKPVLKAGLKKGARVVSHDFDMGDDWAPEKTLQVEADRTHTVYLWTIK